MRFSLVVVLLLVVWMPCFAQQGESLLIHSGDLIHVSVFESSELDQHVRVNDAGQITLLLGGMIKVAGLTPAMAGVEVERALVSGRYMLQPHVSILVEQYATQNATVIGQVKTPGSFPIITPRRVLDVLALAGGLNDVADRHIVVQHVDTGVRVDYFVSNDPKALMDQNLMVAPGDTLYVPHAEVVYVLGDVNRPGGYAKTTNDSKLTVLQSIALAAGTPPTAVPSHARLIRKTANGGYENLPLPLSDMQKGKKPDILLQADDIIYVPFSYLRSTATNIGGIVAATAGAAIYHF